jgi:hypothetical protein
LLRRSDFLPRLYLPLLLLLCAAYAWRPIGGYYDFWAHAAVGRWSWSHASVPNQSLFLWSASSPWVAHSWLSELFLYGLIKLGGNYGPYVVVAFTMSMALLVFALLWRLWAQRAKVNVLMPLLFALAIWCSAPRFQPRQEMFTALFLAILLAYLISWSENRFERQSHGHSTVNLSPTIFGIVPLFAFWVNMHALVAIGLAMLIVTIACDCLQDRFDKRVRILALIGLLCAAMTLINPWGAKYWESALQLRPGGMASFIEEWQSPLKPPVLLPYVLGEAVLVIIAALAWVYNPQRRWAHLVWLLMMSAACLNQRRHLWLLAIVALAVTAANARSLDTQQLWNAWRRRTRQPQMPDIPAGLRYVAQSGIMVCLGVWVAAALSRGVLPLCAVERQVPAGAAHYILQNNVPGHMFNDYENSSYLQWRLNGENPRTGHVSTGGRYPLFIDLLNGYPDQVMADYFDILKVNERGRRLLTVRKVGYVVLGAHHRDSRLAQYLNRSTGWVRVYNESDASIWVRKTQPYQRLWKRGVLQAQRT